MRRARHSTGSLIFDRARGTWRFLQWLGGRRKSQTIGSMQEFPSKSAAWREVERLKLSPEKPVTSDPNTVSVLAARYEIERFPTRHDTARVYRSWLTKHVLPKWGSTPIRDVQPRVVELWLRDLPLSPKSKTHVRSLMHSLLEFAMWAGLLEIGRNPISLVQNIGATRRIRTARNLTVEQFHALLKELHEPFATMALLCVCLGLRMSEALALRWADVDWLGSRVSIERSIVEQHVDECKTANSRRSLGMASELLQRLRAWKQCAQFASEGDWIFASPLKLGRLPYSYTGVWRELERASKLARIGHLGTHAFRHTFRTWLNATGTPIATQQKLMRHTDIRTTMNVYGTVFDDEMTTASGKVARLVFPVNGSQDGSRNQ